MDTKKKPFCNFHGCTNKADILSFHRTFTNDDGKSQWDVFVNCCDEHWDYLVMKYTAEDKMRPIS